MLSQTKNNLDLNLDLLFFLSQSIFAIRCGHCRAFAPLYRQFGVLVKRWTDVAKASFLKTKQIEPILSQFWVAAVNCADSFNSQVCRANSVAYFPMIKYFPRSASGYGDGILMEASW